MFFYRCIVFSFDVGKDPFSWLAGLNQQNKKKLSTLGLYEMRSFGQYDDQNSGDNRRMFPFPAELVLPLCRCGRLFDEYSATQTCEIRIAIR